MEEILSNQLGCYESNILTINARILQIDDSQYTIVIVEDLNRDILDEYKYITLVQLPNWEKIKLNVGDVGYIQFEAVKGGETRYFDRDTQKFEIYQYSNNYLLNFIKKDIELCNKQFRF